MTSVFRRTATGVGLVAAVGAAVWLDAVIPGGVVAWGVITLAAAAASLEASALEARRARPARIPLCAAAAGAIAAAWLRSERAVPDFDGLAGDLGLPYAAAFALALVLGGGRLRVAALAAWIGPPLGLLAAWTRVFGHAALAHLILLSKVGDVAGYFVGRRFGRRHPFPRLSPGKTVAGCVASFAAGTASGAALGAAGVLRLGPAGDLGAAAGALLGAVLNVAAQAGDLLESYVKRRAGAKDSGSLMGASGGVLDVVDSLLLTVPAAWIAAACLA